MRFMNQNEKRKGFEILLRKLRRIIFLHSSTVVPSEPGVVPGSSVIFRMLG
jgi:hypothetical protein